MSGVRSEDGNLCTRSSGLCGVAVDQVCCQCKRTLTPERVMKQRGYQAKFDLVNHYTETLRRTQDRPQEETRRIAAATMGNLCSILKVAYESQILSERLGDALYDTYDTCLLMADQEDDQCGDCDFHLPMCICKLDPPEAVNSPMEQYRLAVTAGDVYLAQSIKNSGFLHAADPLGPIDINHFARTGLYKPHNPTTSPQEDTHMSTQQPIITTTVSLDRVRGDEKITVADIKLLIAEVERVGGDDTSQVSLNRDAYRWDVKLTIKTNEQTVEQPLSDTERIALLDELTSATKERKVEIKKLLGL